jgi:hypothetical protein
LAGAAPPLFAVFVDAVAVVAEGTVFEVAVLVTLVTEGTVVAEEATVVADGTVALTELVVVVLLVDCTELGVGDDTSSCIFTLLFSASRVLNIYVSY